MFAQQDIPAGCIILAEHPTVILPYIIALPTSSTELHANVLEYLSPSKYKEVMSLSRGPFPSDDQVDDVLSANALAVELQVPDGPNADLPIHRALFLKTSRINHSCGPNARWDWDSSTLTLTVTAVRPIRKNEEITITYIAPDQPREERIKCLETVHGFSCVCSYCLILNTDDLLNSDIAREILHNTWTLGNLSSFNKWCRDPSMPDDFLISQHMRALTLIQQEGLQVLDYGPGMHPDLDVGRHCDAIAMCYGALEDTDNFILWIKHVKEMHIVWQPDRAPVFKKWISNPSSFPVWGWRKDSMTDMMSKLGKCESVLDLID
ncbi:hypothetical protein BDQ17DRAFT_515781 [Cyathus striatus]|nr:hypothetical protein BDQ17DRAFT_515781 [Cyathus striatus]